MNKLWWEEVKYVVYYIITLEMIVYDYPIYVHQNLHIYLMCRQIMKSYKTKIAINLHLVSKF